MGRTDRTRDFPIEAFENYTGSIECCGLVEQDFYEELMVVKSTDVKLEKVFVLIR